MTEKEWDPLLDMYVTKNNFVRSFKDVLPEGTEVFVGITLKMDGGEFKQKSAFAKIQNMGKAKAAPKYSKKQKVEMDEKKTLAQEFNNMKLSEDEF